MDEQKQINQSVGICTMERFDSRPLNSVGSSRIRCRWLLDYWPEAEEYIIGKKYDVMIFQKVYWFNMMRAFKGIKILDLCDPDWLENRPVFEFIDLSDIVTTSTETLAEYIRKLRPNCLVKCIPDRVYLPEAKPIKREHSEVLKKVVWFGYSHNAHYLKQVYEELIKRDLELYVIADHPVDPPLLYKSKLKIKNIPYNYETLNKELIKYDAVLMPDPYGDERAKYKSNNKTLQAWSLGIPMIKIPEDIDRLMTKIEREKESEKMLNEIRDKWDVKYSVDEYRELIWEVKKKRVKEGSILQA